MSAWLTRGMTKGLKAIKGNNTKALKAWMKAWPEAAAKPVTETVAVAD